MRTLIFTTTKIQLQRIKSEDIESVAKDTHINGPFTAVAKRVIDEADRAIDMMSTDIQKAKCNWFDALIAYRDTREAFLNRDIAAMQLPPYQQELPEDQNITTPRLTIIEPNRPNLQIQIKPGGREVFHTPDTTGTPQPMIATDNPFPMDDIVHPVSPNYPSSGLTHIPPHTQPQNPVPISPHIFFNMCMEQKQHQQQQPQLLMQEQQQLQINQQQLPMHQRLGPRTPPILQTPPPPLPPKKRPHPLGPREH